MLAKLSVDQALMKAKSHAKKDEFLEAQKLYKAVLLAFPKNIRALQGLATLNSSQQINVVQSPPQEEVSQLINCYNQGHFSVVIEQAHTLTELYPKAFIVWNILGAANLALRRVEQASENFKKVTELNPNYADGFNNLGVSLTDQGELDEAIESYKKVISLKPDYAEAYSNMGNALQDQGKLDEALEAHKKSISLNPNYSKAYNNMGIALRKQNKIEEAIAAFNKSILLKPDYAEAYNNIGNALQDQGKLNEAIDAHKKSISLNPDYSKAYNNMGNALKNLEKLDEAIEAYNKSISLNPDYAEAYNNLGITLRKQHKIKEAIAAYNKALSIKSNYAEAYGNMGNALQDQGKLGEAIQACKKSISLKPDYALAYSNMGNILTDQGKLDEAIEACKKSISLKPDYAEAYNNLAKALHDQGKLDEAIEVFNKSISLKPNYAVAHQNLSFTFLNSGRVQEGLDKYEWRWKADKHLSSRQRYFSQPLWNGEESLYGKRILFWYEQGIGDTINWSSCLSLASSQAEHCILECQEKLVPLLQRSFPNIEVKPENRNLDIERNDFDFHLPMGSLYKHFIKEIRQNAKPDAYLVPDPIRVNFWRERLNSLGKGPYIGVSWKSSNMSPNRLPNYASISDLSPILKIPNVTFINLQYKDFADDLTKIQDKIGVTVNNFDDLDHYNNIDDVAALCTALDMVVSTKMTVPLISAGVGTSTKLANWRQSSWNNVLFNPVSSSVNIFERNIWEPWDITFRSIAKNISQIIKSNHKDIKK